MDIQTIIVIGIALVAAVYLILKYTRAARGAGGCGCGCGEGDCQAKKKDKLGERK